MYKNVLYLYTFVKLKLLNMKFKNSLIFFIVISLIIINACKKEDLFVQPTIEVTNYTLKELPGENTYLEIEMLVHNNDSREANIADVEYSVVVEGVTAKTENVDINQKILVDTPLKLTLPLTLVTKDAISLIEKLHKGEELSYVVKGTFHIDDVILKMFDLPIDIEGSAKIDSGIEDLYKQPDINVNTLEWKATINGITSYTVNVDANCSVKNNDTKAVVIDEVEYIVTVEGVESNTHLYSNTYSTDRHIAGGETILLKLPVVLELNPINGASLVAGLGDGSANFIIEGNFHATKVDGTSVDFTLPLYDTGSVPASEVTK